MTNTARLRRVAVVLETLRADAQWVERQADTGAASVAAYMREAADLLALAQTESDTNARLIAAATEMHEALKEYLEWGAMTGSDRDLFIQKFRAAIAKAECA